MQNRTSINQKPLNKAIIYEGYGALPNETKFVRESESGRLTIVAIGYPAESLATALALVEEGVTLIEFCGYIPLIWKVKIAEVIGNRAKISTVTFGIESVVLAAAYNRSFYEGVPPREAFIILEIGSDPVRDRFEKAFDPQHTTFIPVPDEATAVRVAAELADAGYGLIELYGGFTTMGAARIIEAVDGRIPIGVGSFTLEATL
jgi:hypothetical protein